MKRLFSIEILSHGEKADLYTIRFKGEESETNKFITRFKAEPKYEKDISQIIRTLYNFGERGTLERMFRPERAFQAIPIEKCKLRLICLRLNDSAIILGNGGIKTAKKTQDCPDIFPHFQFMEKLEKELKTRLKSGEVWFNNKQKLRGDLNFEF